MGAFLPDDTIRDECVCVCVSTADEDQNRLSRPGTGHTVAPNRTVNKRFVHLEVHHCCRASYLELPLPLLLLLLLLLLISIFGVSFFPFWSRRKQLRALHFLLLFKIKKKKKNLHSTVVVVVCVFMWVCVVVCVFEIGDPSTSSYSSIFGKGTPSGYER